MTLTHHIQLVQTDAIQGLRGLDAGSIDLIVTDPPYSGMNKHLSLGKGRIVGDYKEAGQDGAAWFEEWSDDPDAFRYFLEECLRVLKPGSHIYVMFDPYSLLTLGPIFREVFDLKNLITWDKVAMGMGYNYRRRSEFILFGKTPGSKVPLTNKGTPDVWAIKRIHNPVYPTMKPVPLFRRMIASSLVTDSGAVVLDPFMGSGSSGVAADLEGHSYIGFDIADKSLAMARERIGVEEGD